MAVDPECICHGNWRKIVKEHEPLLGSTYVGPDGKTYSFFGLVHGDDDYYYGMSCTKGVCLLSCVGSIEGHGFTLKTPPGPRIPFWEELEK